MYSRPHKTYRVVSKFRFSVFIIAVISLLIIGAYLVSAQGVFGGQAQKYERVDVFAGDTVWSIAAERAGDGEDVRDLVREIRKANNLNDNAVIYAGQVLKAPV